LRSKVLRLNAEELAAEEQSKRRNKNSAAQAVSDAEKRQHGVQAAFLHVLMICHHVVSTTTC